MVDRSSGVLAFGLAAVFSLENVDGKVSLTSLNSVGCSYVIFMLGVRLSY